MTENIRPPGAIKKEMWDSARQHLDCVVYMDNPYCFYKFNGGIAKRKC
jgi:hypothetical protein